MNRTLNTAAMREADRRCIEELGIPGAVLMNNAGAAVYRELPPGAVGVVCGKGNNGGDGFVVARYALLDKRPVRVVLLARREELRGDAATFMRAYERLGGTIEEATDEDEAAERVRALRDCDVLVDAMLGTGVTGEVRGVIRAAIEHWPEAPTVAVDVPTGLDCDTGEVCGAAVRAAKTVTLQFRKPCFDNASSQPYYGEVVVADIGIPAVCADDAAWAKLTKDWRD